MEASIYLYIGQNGVKNALSPVLIDFLGILEFLTLYVLFVERISSKFVQLTLITNFKKLNK
jgi:hypothetical protein